MPAVSEYTMRHAVTALKGRDKRADGGEHKDEDDEKQELRPGTDDGGE